MANLFDCFIHGGFECSTLRLSDGHRRDLLETTGHAKHAWTDFRTLASLGIRTVRDGARWHLIEREEGVFDWSSFLPQLDAAARCDMQVIWDLCHYGWPDHIDIWSPRFPERFARFARGLAVLVRDACVRTPFYCPINEVSFLAWGGGQMGYFTPFGVGRGDALKRQLVRASLAAMDAIRLADPRARFVLADPMIRAVAMNADDQPLAAAATQAQYEAWDMIAGMASPELGGAHRYLDVVGVNFYPHNQWYLNGPTIPLQHEAHTPMRNLLGEVYRRYRRPMVVSETGAEGNLRAVWMRYVCEEVAAAISAGVPIEGVCVYPITDYPGWEDDRHCETGLLGYPDPEGHRAIHLPLAAEIAAQQRRFAQMRTDRSGRRLADAPGAIRERNAL